ncbi:MAG: hypothetical protein ACF8XB_05180 [Planctomycetota bacterium JB042]
MFGSLFRLGMLATLVGGSTFALVGPERIKMYFDHGKQSVLEAIDGAQSMESKLELIRTQIAGLDGESKRLRKESIERRVETDRLAIEVAERENALEKRAAVLERVSKMLAEGKEQYVIGRTVYTRSEIEQDAAEKLALYNVQLETVKSLKETLSTKERAQEIAAENVGRAQALRAELASKVQLLEAQLQKHRAKEMFAATVEKVVDTSELDSDLARARELIQDFEQDLEVRVRMLDERLNQGTEQPAGGIDYGSAEDGGDEDLVGQIRRALDSSVALTVVNGGDDDLAVTVAVH